MTILVISAALLLPFSGLTPESSAAPTPASISQINSPAQGSLSPNGGSTDGGETVTITVDEPPSITDAAHGSGFGLAVTDARHVIAWGSALEAKNPILVDPAVFADDPVTTVAASDKTAYALTEQGNVYA